MPRKELARYSGKVREIKIYENATFVTLDETKSFLLYSVMPQEDRERLLGKQVHYSSCEYGIIFKDVEQIFESPGYTWRIKASKSNAKRIEKKNKAVIK